MPRRIDPRPILVLFGFLGLCLTVAAAEAALAARGMRNWYPTLRQPPGAPPDWLLPAAWIPLSVAMAVAAWRVWRWNPLSRLPDLVLQLRPAGRRRSGPVLRRRGLLLWGWQLGIGALWPPLFFGLHRPVAAFELILGLTLLVALMLRDFHRIDRVAALLMAAYLGWLCYAAWLNAGIAWLNPT